MQNKCGCGCQRGFVSADSNWDFNMNGACACQQNYTRKRRRSDCGCDECEKTHTRFRSNDDCQCERCDDEREVACCEKNTYIREFEADCACKDHDRNRSNGCHKCDECESAYNNNRSTCTGKDDCQCEACTRKRRRYHDCDECEAAYNNSRSTCTGKDDCQCEACTRKRRRYHDCDECESAYNNSRSACTGKDDCQCEVCTRKRRRYHDCDCKNNGDNASTYARSGKNRKVGIVNVAKQEIDEIYESESGLRAGTLFPELHKPLNGYCPCDKNCGTCKQAAAFAAWELRLYLNTHPNDKEALALFRKLCKEAEDENYATTFLTDECCTSGWNWVKNPWPWEYDCNCGD